MIVTVGNTKGGVGKTTLALNIAIARALAGRDVWLIDGDRQGTAQTALTIRSEAGRVPAIACAQYSDGSTLRAQVLQVGPKFDDIIIDAGGRDSTAQRQRSFVTAHSAGFRTYLIEEGLERGLAKQMPCHLR